MIGWTRVANSGFGRNACLDGGGDRGTNVYAARQHTTGGRMDVQDMHIFARVAAVQNLSAVGAELGLTPGTISKRVQALEDELAVRLFDRTTRSIRITDEGATFLSHVERILAELTAVRGLIADATGSPKGRLKVAAAHRIGNKFLAPAVVAFLRQFPEIDVSLDITDRPVNLQEDGYDLAIHAGPLADSATMSKRLAADNQCLVAAPAYLAAHGTPVIPDDLAQHQCLVLGEAQQWAFGSSGSETNVRINARFRSDSGEILRLAAVQGQGVLRTTEFQVLDEMQSGQLVRVLAGAQMPGNTAIWALYPSGRYVLPRLRVFLDFLAEWFKSARTGPQTGPEITATGHLTMTAARTGTNR
jgi:DNA-binding transcriptional LysR family regulator